MPNESPPTAELDWTSELVDQLDWHWQAAARPRLDGLTDEEYRWEPVPGCWSIRPRADVQTELVAGAGDLVMEAVLPPPDPAPVTTIAWRIGHVAVGCFRMRTASHFGGPDVNWGNAVWPTTAAEALADLDDAYAAWSAGARSLDAERLRAPVGPREGFPDAPYAGLVLHINREAIHHLAEIALLRDLYRATHGA